MAVQEQHGGPVPGVPNAQNCLAGVNVLVVKALEHGTFVPNTQRAGTIGTPPVLASKGTMRAREEYDLTLGLEVAGSIVAAAVVAAGFALRSHSRVKPVVQPQPAPAPAQPVRVTAGEVQLVRPNAGSVEGLEIRYGQDGLVRSARVGAMNSEHKELLLTMDEAQWNRLPNAQKQEVLAAARSTWAEKICKEGPDIAYLIVKTERGQTVGRADPHNVTVL